MAKEDLPTENIRKSCLENPGTILKPNFRHFNILQCTMYRVRTAVEVIQVGPLVLTEASPIDMLQHHMT